MKTIHQLLFVFCFSFFSQMYGQEQKYNGNPDTSFETARKLAFNEHRKQAQDTLTSILTKYPDYHDIRSFLATTYAWDGNYKRARKEFSYVMEKDSKNKSNWIAAINNELWADSPYTALEMTTTALTIFPDDAEIMYQKASAQENTNNPFEAIKTIDAAIAKNPTNQKAIDFKNSLNQKLRKYSIGIKSTVDLYSEVFDPMQYHTLKLSHITKYGSVIAKLNFNRRFNTNGTQIEVDLYPKIAKGLYAYLNFGLSNSAIFPHFRYGGELYQSLPHSFEASLGFRTLQYSTTTTIYTGSIGWYTGNDYWSIRPYITPGDGGTSTSGALTYRKYRANADNYLSFGYSMGFSPETNQFYFDANDAAIINLKSQKINVGYNFTTSNNKNAWGAQFDVTHQEKSFAPGSYLWIYSLSLSWDLKFK
ncbi:YaiO family outer membrane beta-barrel protein [Flavobacterium cellulosilyticum]|nr:YaiO family outer membrane beta-barrel protein [Flavobacterium cellulosilyticum]